MPRPDILSRRGVLIGGALGLLGVPTRSFAQPDMQRLAPPTIADRGSALYRFLTIPVASQHGARSYRLIVAVPRRMAPQSGYPIAWLLDGKAAMAHVDEALLASLDAAGPPVIVAIGHDTPLRLDGPERARDYTPTAPGAGQGARLGGGADAFLATILDVMRPKVESVAPIDPRRQTIWGHSLGGLFVLHSLMRRPDAFTGYYAASPSLWWDGGAIMTMAVAAPTHPRRCTLLIGEGSAVAQDRQGRPRTTRFHVDAAERDAFYHRLQTRSAANVKQIDLGPLPHGATFGATIAPALRLAIRL